MTSYSRRQYLQGMLATSLLLALYQCNSMSSSPLVEAAESRRWQLGIGADPSKFLTEVRMDPAVHAVAQAWTPQFLTGWLNSFDHRQGDLSFWRRWHQQDLLSAWFSQGYSLQIVTWEDDQVRPTGEYHISPQYLEDLEELARYIRQANPQGRPTYWTLATEFSFWRLPADTYNSATAEYYQALMQNLLRAKAVIKNQLPTAWVAPSWGGWIVTFDDSSSGAGRSMIPPFATFLQEMDGVAFQAMRPKSAGEYNVQIQSADLGNPEQIRQCCEVFSRYRPSLMVSHYEPAIKEFHPNGGRADTATQDFLIMMRPTWMEAVTRLGLDKFSLMHYGLYKGNPYNALAAAQTFQEITQRKSCIPG